MPSGFCWRAVETSMKSSSVPVRPVLKMTDFSVPAAG